MGNRKNYLVQKSNLIVTYSGELIFLGDSLYKVLGIEEFQKELYFKLKP